MGNATRRSRGFTLIASLLMLALLSGIALGLMYLVNGSARMGGNDLESNMAYYGAEAGMEKLTTDVLTLYQQKMSPTQQDFNTLASTSGPSSALVGGMTYNESVQLVAAPPGLVTLSSGNFHGLMAQTIPITLQVSAIRPSGAAVNMTRGVEVALIPVFQFGVFSDSDLSYFPGPQFGFQGRAHTNGNLFLAADSGPLILGAQVTAFREIIRDRLANNFSNGSSYQGSVFVSNQAGGCDSYINGGSSAGAHCLDFGPDSNNSTNDASWSGGIPTAGSSNGNWAAGTNISTSTFGGIIGNGASTSVKQLQLPFVQGATANQSDQQIKIIRKAAVGELATSPLGVSREFNKATIRVLLADTQADLHPERTVTDPGEDVDLTGGGSATGLAIAVSGTGGTTRLAMATPTKDTYWTAKPTGVTAYTGNIWNLVNGWLRVEYLDKTSGLWVGVTNQWLGYGFARGVVSPTVPVGGGAGSNTVHPRAILILQQQADRNADGSIPAPSGSPNGSAPGSGSDAPYNIIDGSTAPNYSQYSWYPLNFFDPREGYPRDFSSSSSYSPAISGTQCYVNGIMNAVELDVGNLQKWIQGVSPYGTTGQNVNYTNQNGYLLYFSDRRGEALDPNATPTPNVTSGKYGFEDVINSSSATGTPDNLLELPTAGYNANSGFSPEDVDQNTLRDNWGAVNVGKGWGLDTTNNPYKAVDCKNGGRQNIVMGARHVLKLVDGGLGRLPSRPDYPATAPTPGGFTVTSENPVYVQGNYNTNGTDGFWGDPTSGDPTGHVAAAVIADAVTLLSNAWGDTNSMVNPLTADGSCPSSNKTGLCNRIGTETYYRMAIAAGKNMNFPRPGGTPAPPNDFGTDGGVHNFLRYIENWNATLHYRGSIVSLYYAQYATGVYKCCNQVYQPPTRDYYFDADFLTPNQLPPGTPMMLDIENLSYWQNFNPCSAQSGGKCTN